MITYTGNTNLYRTPEIRNLTKDILNTLKNPDIHTRITNNTQNLASRRSPTRINLDYRPELLNIYKMPVAKNDEGSDIPSKSNNHIEKNTELNIDQTILDKKRFIFNGFNQKSNGLDENGDINHTHESQLNKSNMYDVYRPTSNINKDNVVPKQIRNILPCNIQKNNEKDIQINKFESKFKNTIKVDKQFIKPKTPNNDKTLARMIYQNKPEANKKIGDLLLNDSILLNSNRLEQNKILSNSNNFHSDREIFLMKDQKDPRRFDEYGIMKENNNPNSTAHKFNHFINHDNIKPGTVIYNVNNINSFKNAKTNFNNLKDSRIFILNNIGSKDKDNEKNNIDDSISSPLTSFNTIDDQVNDFNSNIDKSRLDQNYKSFIGINTNLCKQITNKELDHYLKYQEKKNTNERRSCFNPTVNPKKSALKKTKSTILKRVTIAEERNSRYEVSRWLKEAHFEYSPAVIRHENRTEVIRNISSLAFKSHEPQENQIQNRLCTIYKNPVLDTVSSENNKVRCDSLRNVNSTGVIHKRISLDERKNGSTVFYL